MHNYLSDVHVLRLYMCLVEDFKTFVEPHIRELVYDLGRRNGVRIPTKRSQRMGRSSYPGTVHVHVHVRGTFIEMWK